MKALWEAFTILLICAFLLYRIINDPTAINIFVISFSHGSLFAIIVLQKYCYYKWSVALPHGAVGWSAMCDSGISWSYSFTFLLNSLRKRDNMLVYRFSSTFFYNAILHEHSCVDRLFNLEAISLMLWCIWKNQVLFPMAHTLRAHIARLGESLYW